jgi:hypothetical protein
MSRQPKPDPQRSPYFDPEPRDLARCVSSWMGFCARSGITFAQPSNSEARAYRIADDLFIEFCCDDEVFAAFFVTPKRVTRLEQVTR